MVENLELERQPMPSTEAIYFISPTVSSPAALFSQRESSSP